MREASKASPIAEESCCMAAICSCIPFWVEYMPRTMAFMFFMVATISGIIATIWGIRESMRSISGSRVWMESVMVSMPSILSNTDRMAVQTGMS